jgi:hypothetical protein
MKKNILKIFFILLYFSAIDSINAQSLTVLEKKYDQLRNQYDKENKILDSLKNIFSIKAEQIDSEKKKKNPDNDKIVDLMAGTVAVLNKIEERNKKINLIKKDIENIKQQLNIGYNAKIDSLELQMKAEGKDEDELNAEILLFTEKKLLVAPRIPSLSFNPEKILEIDLNKTKDPKEKSLYKEYLNNALNEVNNLLENINIQILETDQVVTLQTKTRKFLEEAELESNMIIQGQRNQTSEINAGPRTDEGIGVRGTSNDFASNIRTYQLILSQLDIQQLSKTDLKWEISSDEINRNFNVKEYQRLLKEVKKRLQEFKLVLANKTGSSK